MLPGVRNVARTSWGLVESARNFSHITDWMKHMPTVAYRVHSVIFCWPDAPSFFSSYNLGTAVWRSWKMIAAVM